MKIGIVGVGMVGGTVSYGLKRIGHDVIEHDIKLDSKLEDVLPASLVFVCVPTPCDADGSCDIRHVEEVIEDLDGLQYKGLVVIKSTVTPGTTDRLQYRCPHLRLAFCPEFLREKTCYTDFIDNHEVCIVGAVKEKDFELIKQAHGNLPKQVVQLRPLEAELTKYFSNCFNALRIVFANQFYEVCQAAGADYQAVKDAVVKRSSIGNYYLECNESFREFGGNCLPKDTSAFRKFVHRLGFIHPTIFDFIVAENARIKDRAREEWLMAKNTKLDEFNKRAAG